MDTPAVTTEIGTVIGNLLRSLAEALRPFLGIDNVDTPGAEGIVDTVEEVVEAYFQNDTSILTDSSFDPSAYGCLTSDDFRDELETHDVMVNRNFDPSDFDLVERGDLNVDPADLMDSSDIDYAIDQKVESAIEELGDTGHFRRMVEAVVTEVVADLSFTITVTTPDSNGTGPEAVAEVVIAGV